MVNPNNYPGAETTVVGWLAGGLRNPAYDPEGKKGIKEFSVPINEGYKKDGEFVQTGTTWYTYTATEDWFNQQGLTGLMKGTKVRIEDAKQEVRTYEGKDGKEHLAIALRFGTVTILEAPDSDEPVF